MNALDAAIYGRLQTHAALTALLAGTTSIYSLMAPDAAATPYIEFGIQGGGDENMTPVRMKNQVVRIKAVTKSPQTKGNAGSIDAVIDARLEGHSLVISGWGTTFWLAREQDFEFSDVDEAGNTYWHVGGLYRVRYNEL